MHTNLQRSHPARVLVAARIAARLQRAAGRALDQGQTSVEWDTLRGILAGVDLEDDEGAGLLTPSLPDLTMLGAEALFACALEQRTYVHVSLPERGVHAYAFVAEDQAEQAVWGSPTVHELVEELARALLDEDLDAELDAAGALRAHLLARLRECRPTPVLVRVT